MKSKVLVVFITILLALSAINSTSLAAPSANNICEFTQPSGEKFKAYIRGDERLNWLETVTGEILMLSPDGNYKYATMTSTGLQPGKTTFSPSQKTTGEITVNNLSECLALSNIPSVDNIPSINTLSSSDPTGPRITGPHHALVLLVEFADISMQNPDPAIWSNLIFGNSGKTVNTYFKEVSNDLFYLIPAEEINETENDGVIRVTLPYNHPDTFNWLDKPSGKVVQEALQAADPYIDYSRYDLNNNGVLMSDELHIIAVFAGYERSYTSRKPSVWARHGQLGGIELDGVRYVGYHTVQGEMHGDHIATIGVFCHELGHDLGLRDLYDIDGSSSGVGIHSLMGSGNWGDMTGEFPGTTPVHLDPWSKSFLGFVNPQVITSSGIYTLNASPYNYNVLKIPTANPYEYFLLENRQFNGFDAPLQYSIGIGGIAIWHIDQGQQTNNNEEHKFVDLEEANEGILGFSQLDTRNMTSGKLEHYYNPYVNTLFSNEATPDSSLYCGQATDITVNIISDSADTMQVSIELGEDSTPLPKPNPEPISLTIESLIADKPSPQKIYNPIRWTCNTWGGSDNKLYKFDVYNGILPVQYGIWTTNNYFDWYPFTPSPFYKIKVTVMDLSDGTIVSETSPYYSINLF